MCVCCHCSLQLTEDGCVLILQVGDDFYDLTASNTFITLNKFYWYFLRLPSMSRFIHVYASLQMLANSLIMHFTQSLAPVNPTEIPRHWDIVSELRLTR